MTYIYKSSYFTQAAIQKLLPSKQLRRSWGLPSLRRGCHALRLLRARWLEAACMATEARHVAPLMAYQLAGRDATARYHAFATRRFTPRHIGRVGL